MKPQRMGREFVMYQGREMHTVVWWGNLKEGGHLEEKV
jgi:hypothetical protein